MFNDKTSIELSLLLFTKMKITQIVGESLPTTKYNTMKYNTMKLQSVMVFLMFVTDSFTSTTRNQICYWQQGRYLFTDKKGNNLFTLTTSGKFVTDNKGENLLSFDNKGENLAC